MQIKDKSGWTILQLMGNMHRIQCCDCKINKKKQNEVIIATASWAHVLINSISFKFSKNNQIKMKSTVLMSIHEDHNGACPITLSLSYNSKYIATGWAVAGLISVYNVKNRKQYREFMEAFSDVIVWQLEFSKHNDEILFSLQDSETVVYNLNKSEILFKMNNDRCEPNTIRGSIKDLNHLYLNQKHIITACDQKVDKLQRYKSTIYIHNITDKLNNKTSHIQSDEAMSIDAFDEDSECFLKLSPNGEFIAITGCMNGYCLFEIYHFDSNKIWHKIHNKQIHKKTDLNVLRLTWIDNDTLMCVSYDKNDICVANIWENNQNIKYAITDGIKNILRAINVFDFKWIIDSIELFLPRWYVTNYEIENNIFAVNTDTDLDEKTGCFSDIVSCQIERDNNIKTNIVVVTHWCGQIFFLVK
eukprot:506317_1